MFDLSRKEKWLAFVRDGLVQTVLVILMLGCAVMMVYLSLFGGE